MNGGNTALDRARIRLLGPAGLDEAAIGRALGVLASGGADIAELYFEATSMRSWHLEGAASPRAVSRCGRVSVPVRRIAAR
ncbi:hypothetical protein P0F65_12305 [Sphingomonas sp. I4]